MKTIIALIILFGVAFAFTTIISEGYDAGVRAGYDKGFEEGIRRASEAFRERTKQWEEI